MVAFKLCMFSLGVFDVVTYEYLCDQASLECKLEDHWASYDFKDCVKKGKFLGELEGYSIGSGILINISQMFSRRALAPRKTFFRLPLCQK